MPAFKHLPAWQDGRHCARDPPHPPKTRQSGAGGGRANLTGLPRRRSLSRSRLRLRPAGLRSFGLLGTASLASPLALVFAASFPPSAAAPSPPMRSLGLSSLPFVPVNGGGGPGRVAPSAAASGASSLPSSFVCREHPGSCMNNAAQQAQLCSQCAARGNHTIEHLEEREASCDNQEVSNPENSALCAAAGRGGQQASSVQQRCVTTLSDWSRPLRETLSTTHA